MSTLTPPQPGTHARPGNRRRVRTTGGTIDRAVARVAVRATRFRHALGIPSLLAIAVIVFSQLVAQELQMVLDTTFDVVLGIIACALVIALLTFRWTSQLPTAVGAGGYGTSGDAKLASRRGIVMLVGLDSAQPASAAATLFASTPNVSYLALVGTVETEAMGVTSQVASRVAPAAGLRIPDAHVRTWGFGNAESVADTEQAVAEAIRWMLGRGLDPSEIVLDVSAGRRAMGYGAKDAADDAVVETQYLASTWDSATNRPVPGTNMFKIVKTYH